MRTGMTQRAEGFSEEGTFANRMAKYAPGAAKTDAHGPAEGQERWQAALGPDGVQTGSLSGDGAAGRRDPARYSDDTHRNQKGGAGRYCQRENDNRDRGDEDPKRRARQHPEGHPASKRFHA